MENFICITEGIFLKPCDFQFTEKGKDYECKFVGGKQVEVAISVNGKLKENFTATCKPVEYNDYYSFCERIARQVIQ